ncbi:MAG: selenide, water dikinase SelD [Defluviitaleaceae bacterium]|nr:selenide, water dikinase SelD [Defluviitaleaceae bacterium]
MLDKALGSIPPFFDKNLLVGFDSNDDGAVYKLSEDLAIIQTLDFFPPMVDDPYIFGQVAAANALSDVAAMGGIPKVALNIVAFPEDADPEILSAILAGGANKVAEAGAVLCGGHSIADSSIKYGLSVTGVVHPDKILQNNTCRIGDVIVLTKPLGVGIITAAYGSGEASKAAYDEAIVAMTTLNQHALDVAREYDISAATDVTGFGFLGHLNEMANKGYSIEVNSGAVPYIDDAYGLAEQFMTTSAGAKNRQFLEGKIDGLNKISHPMQEILLDPQTSGGLLISIKSTDAPILVKELGGLGYRAAAVANVVKKRQANIIIY